MIRSDGQPRNGGTGRIAAAAMTLCVAAATVTSTLALDGLADSPADPQAAMPQVKTVVVDVKTVKAEDAKEPEQPVRVLKAAPAPRRLARKRPAPAVEAVAVAIAGMPAGNMDGQVRQYLMQFRPILRAEYHIVRAVCRPTPEQRTELARSGEQTLREAAKKYVDMMRRPMTAAQRAALDPRKQIREGLARAVKEKLSADLAARFEAEIARRDASRKQLAVRNLVARLDRDLVLGTDQRAKVAESLTAHWDDSWCQSLEMFMYDYQFLPPIPDQYVAPFLNEPQKKIWRSTQKIGAFWGGFGMMNGQMADDQLEDDELRLARKEADENDPNPAANRGGMMGVMMKGAVMPMEVVRPAAPVEKAGRAKAGVRKVPPPTKAQARPAVEIKK